MALKWPTNNVVSIFADKTIALKMTPRQQAQQMPGFLTIWSFEAHLFQAFLAYRT